MSLPAPLPSNAPSLSERLRCRSNELCSRVIRGNHLTQFAQTVPELADFRRVTAGLVDKMSDEVLAELFRRTVPFTTYDAYAPLAARFSEKPCKESTVANLFAPGLPDFLVESTSTSGGRPKLFPKYNCASRMKSSGTGSWGASGRLRRRTKAYIWFLGVEPVDAMNDDGSPVKTVHLTRGSIVGQRTRRHFDPDDDDEKMGTCILDHAAPFAATFIWRWRPFLLIHALFALAFRSLETIDMLFINTFVEMMRCVDAEYDMLVDCIENGTIPDLDGIDEARRYLEVNIFPNPKRAEELRRLGRPCSQPGWCGRAWPSLCSLTATASGSFASSIPMTRWFLGPNVNILSHGYGSTEAYIGPPYDPVELNQYKPVSDIAFEFLDISKSDSISSLAQSWEVELGRRYELVLTSEDGLWRYRLGDVVEIAGFDPRDGAPVIQFVERRNVVIRLPALMVTEKELQAAVSSMSLNVVNWTTTIDDRCVSDTVGFFIELSDDEASDDEPDFSLASERALDELLRLHPNCAGFVQKPTIRLVRPGTFCDFLQLKLDEGGRGVGQTKVPIVLPKPEYVTWFTRRVVQEL